MLTHPVLLHPQTLRRLTVACLATLPLGLSFAAAPKSTLTQGTINTTPYTLWCGAQALHVQPVGRALALTLNGETQVVKPTISASGARYTLPNDDTTVFWNKGELSSLTWQGMNLPVCAPLGAVVTPYQAKGTEPFWSVTYDGWNLTLRRPEGNLPELPAQVASRSPSQTVITAGQGMQQLRLTVNAGICQDGMTDMPYPQSTQLEVNGKTFKGCGGDPARFLQGPEWQILLINGQTLPAGAAIPTLRFRHDGKVTGFSGCNRFMGSYVLTGEGLSLSQLAGTRMACNAPNADLEQTILTHLESVQGLTVPAQGQLVLRTAQGTLTAKAQ